VQHLRAETHRLERPGAEILDQHPGRRCEVEQQLAAACRSKAERQALFVARIDLPMDADTIGLPGAQRIALFWVLDLDHLGAKISELQADHVARDEPRHINDPHPVERTGRPGLEGLLRHMHRSDPTPRL
jgi:hypothetical protein